MQGTSIFFYFTVRNGSDKLSRRISLDPERAIKKLGLFIYRYLPFFISLNISALRLIDFRRQNQTILRVITRLKGLSMKEVYQNVNILADCVYAMITRVYLHGISAEIKRPLHLVNTNR